MKKISTLIVGLGKIGMIYDFSKKKHFNNHCEAISLHKNYNLIGAVETSIIKRNLFKKKYNLPVFTNLKSAYLKLNPKMIIISIPTDKMVGIYNFIKKKKIYPPIFLVEKPGSYKFGEFKKFLQFCRKKKIKIFVNYTRSYSNFTNKFKKILNFRNFGKIEKIEIIYKKGFYNSCSHYIDLLLNIFNTNENKIVDITKKVKIKKDFLIDCKIKIKNIIHFKFTKNKIKEKIIFYGNQKKLVYLTEYSKIYYINGHKKIINNDYNKNLKNILDKIKENDRKQSEINISRSLITLKIISQIIKKNVKKK